MTDRHANRSEAGRIVPTELTAGPSDPHAARAHAALAAALRIGEALREAVARAKSLVDIALALAQSGEPDRAIETFRQARQALLSAAELPWDTTRDALIYLAAAQAQAGDLAGAAQTVEAFVTPHDRTWAAHRIAVARATAGDFAGAMEAARGVKDAFTAVWTLCGIGRAQVDRLLNVNAEKTFLTAERVAAEIDRNDPSGGIALFSVVEAQARAGLVAGAMRGAALMPKSTTQQMALCEVARAQAIAGDIDGALDTARRMESARHIPTALCHIAAEQTAIGDTAAASDCFQTALDTAAAIEPISNRAVGLSLVATFMAIAGHIEAAQAALELAEPTYRAALRAAAEGAEFYRGVEKRDHAIGALALAQTEAGRHAEAETTLAAITEPGARAEALRDIASACAYAGDIAGALDTVGRIVGEDDRAEALAEITGVQAHVGDLDGAEATAAMVAPGAHAVNAWLSVFRARLDADAARNGREPHAWMSLTF